MEKGNDRRWSKDLQLKSKMMRKDEKASETLKCEVFDVLYNVWTLDERIETEDDTIGAIVPGSNKRICAWWGADR